MPYSDKENVNILTALLVAHGVKHAVVCPGSRNAPIVHNLNECPNITCHPVTDERSAGFYALGMAQILRHPVAVCVTSGTALLNLLPATAEAYYQHVPLVVISADRPAMWIDQQDGQTLPQLDALGRFVSKAVSLPEPSTDDERWYCNRLVNEALLCCQRHGGSPVHLNVPISEPLFTFNVSALPTERAIQQVAATTDVAHCQPLLADIQSAQRPMIVVGQLSNKEAQRMALQLYEMSADVVVIYECLGMACHEDASRNPYPPTERLFPLHIDKVLMRMQQVEQYQPDVVVYLGGALVSKRLKAFLRQSPAAKTWIVNERGAIYDTFQNLTGVIEGAPNDVLEVILQYVRGEKEKQRLPFESGFRSRWATLIKQVQAQNERFHPPYSSWQAVKIFFETASNKGRYVLHAANSMSVRLVNHFASDYVFCNRGVNGIDGSLSTAAGCSLVTTQNVYCVIGDLSFFYDQNALWHNLGGNFRVLLLNNGGGVIFQSLPGLKDSTAQQTLISAQHHTTAWGICQQNNVAYLSAHDEEELENNMNRFVNDNFDRPVVFEVFTSQEQDEQAMNEYKQV
ncbi:2-succinyl-5-enolpyruvyl-6-hydroxy-3-cyclohexene-1-carboxylic-acid synthase [Hoylesella timonensis]|uniref:2-succinyl-5-enolpyruvyl-6-hydroxy-3- cyclohexene-1-carboxylic-acid synthase n=1 Tax=Hoylesella timonensis TaxID=386414 RepID=UPI0028899EB2|nr:2-succinyl-5-enolpyruvyl-6-hydroxy-3-cyclohexene-1-carboxylic-acid synthase [Hoylesella timonensis]